MEICSEPSKVTMSRGQFNPVCPCGKNDHNKGDDSHGPGPGSRVPAMQSISHGFSGEADFSLICAVATINQSQQALGAVAQKKSPMQCRVGMTMTLGGVGGLSLGYTRSGTPKLPLPLECTLGTCCYTGTVGAKRSHFLRFLFPTPGQIGFVSLIIMRHTATDGNTGPHFFLQDAGRSKVRDCHRVQIMQGRPLITRGSRYQVLQYVS